MSIRFRCGKKDFPNCPGHDGPPWCGETQADVDRREARLKLLVHWDGAKCMLAGDDQDGNNPDALRSTLVEELTCWMCKAMKTS